MRSMKKRRFWDQAGFTLVEATVTAALVGALSLAVISQMQLVGTSKRESNESAIINGITDRLATELSRRETCSSGLNFGNKTISTGADLNILSIVDSENNVIVAPNMKFGRKDAGGNSAAAANVEVVEVRSITARQNAANLDEMILTVNFNKKKSLIAAFLPAGKIVLPINIIRTGGLINYCYNDITNSITSAIRLSCRGSNSSWFNAAANNTYGACEHNVQTNICPNGKFLKRIEWAGNQIQYSCVALEAACPVNRHITGFALDGSVTCSLPLPNCSAGQMMVMAAGGEYTCLNTDTGCTGLNAIKGFTSTGVVCSRFYAQQSCVGLVTSIAPDGTNTCSAYVQPVTCPTGHFVSSIDGSGVPVCSKYINFPASCPAGWAVDGVNSSGDITCKEMTRRLSCGGSMSPSGKTFKNCEADGGTVMNRDGGTNSFCRFNAASCPGGYSACSSWRHTTNTQCTDSNSACSYSVQTRYLSGSNVFTNPVNPGTVQCYYWARNSGPWVYSCSQLLGPTGTTPIIQVGCY